MMLSRTNEGLGVLVNMLMKQDRRTCTALHPRPENPVGPIDPPNSKPVNVI